MPTRYEDLRLPKWKNQIVMANPANHARTISWLIGLKEENVFKTEAEWRAFLQGLAANQAMFVASFGPTPAAHNRVNGRVDSLLFVGKAHEVEVRVGEWLQLAKVDPDQKLAQGDAVSFTLDPAHGLLVAI